MASRDTNLNINVTADNRASDELRKVADDARQLEDGVDVPLTADDQASDDIDQVQAKARELDGTTAEVTATADTDQALGDLDRVESAVRDVDGRRARVTAEADVDQAIGDIDRLEAKLRDLDGRRAGLGVGGAAAAGAAGGAVAGSGVPVVGDIVESASAAGNLALQVQQLADMTGAPLEKAAQLAGVWRDAGLDLADLFDLIANLNQVLADQPDLKEKLGISGATDLVDVFVQSVGGIADAYDTAGSRLQARSQLFGEEGARQVQQITTLVGDVEKAVADRSPLVGPDDVERSREINRQMTDAKNKWDAVQLKVLETLNLVLGKEFDDTLTRFIFGTGANLEPRDQFGSGNFLGVGAGGFHEPRNALFDEAISGITNVIFEAPGSPTRNVEATRTYYRRNGVILS